MSKNYWNLERSDNVFIEKIMDKKLSINFKNIFKILKAYILRFFRIYKDKSLIPDGFYCLTYSEGLNVKLCPYYKQITRTYNGCEFLGIINNDLAFDDMCKICKENNKIEIYDENDNVIKVL